jgi:hypothetical protein
VKVKVLELRRRNDFASIVKYNANTSVAKEISETVLLTVIDPFSDPVRRSYITRFEINIVLKDKDRGRTRLH